MNVTSFDLPVPVPEKIHHAVCVHYVLSYVIVNKIQCFCFCLIEKQLGPVWYEVQREFLTQVVPFSRIFVSKWREKKKR